MFFSRAFIWGTIVSSCVFASIPYIAILYDEHEVALYNAGHAERVERYKKDLAEYPEKKNKCANKGKAKVLQALPGTPHLE